MNDTFDFGRLKQLFRLHLRTHIFPILLAWIIMIGTLVLLQCTIMFHTDSGGAGRILGYSILAIVFFFIQGLVMQIFAALAFRQYHNRASATPLFMLPCSRGEQFVSLTLFYTFAVPLLFLFGFGLVELGFFGVELQGEQVWERLAESPLADYFSPLYIVGIFLSAFWGQAMYQLGSILFKSFAFIITVSIYVCCAILYWSLTKFFGFSLVEDGVGFGMFVQVILVPILLLAAFLGIGWAVFRRKELP